MFSYIKKRTKKYTLPQIVKAKDLGLPYTQQTVEVKFILNNKQEYSIKSTFYLSNYLDCDTVKEAKVKLDEVTKDALDKANKMIEENLGRDDGYITYNGFTVKNNQLSAADVNVYGNRWDVNVGRESRPDGGWPWSPDEE